MTYDFDALLDRRYTGALKWDRRTPEEKDRGVVPMSVADMEFPCAPEIQAAVRAYAEHGLYGYTDPEESYFEAVTGWMAGRHGYAVKREEIVCENGVVPALSTALRALTREGDGVIVLTPAYYPFVQVIELNGRKVAACPLRNTRGRYELDFNCLEELARDGRTTALMLCSPHNPVGRVWTRGELHEIVEICARHDVVILCDEIHHDIVLEGEHTVICNAHQRAREISVVCTSASKTFNLAGLRLANILIENPELRRRYCRRQTADGNSNISYFGRAATIAAYTHCGLWVDELCAYLRGNFVLFRDFLADRFPEIVVTPLQGTYLAWADFRAWALDDEALSLYLRGKVQLILDDGYIFGADGSGFERFNIALPRAELERALDRLAAAGRP